MVRISTRTAATLLGAGVALAGAPALAATYSFTNITNNGAASVAIGIAQISMDVTDAGAGLVLFTISNTGPNASAIPNIYWDNAGGSLGGIDAILNSPPAVSFSSGGSPGNVPGSENASPSFDADFRVGAASPPPQRGINPGESLGVRFSLAQGFLFSDVLSQLDAGDLRVAMHVIAFANGESESFINVPNDDGGPIVGIPLPTPVGLGAAGLLGVGAIRRRRGV